MSAAFPGGGGCTGAAFGALSQGSGFMKLKSRFLMEHARNGIERVEAELYMDEALRIFPEDGYFLKYKGELQWMLGKCADALEIFADAREHTDNQVVLA